MAAATGLLTSADAAVKGADVPGLSADLRQTSGQFRALASSPELAKLLSGGASSTERLAQLSVRMTALITALDATVRQVSGGAAQLQAGLAPLVRNMQAASENLRELTASLRQDPAQVLSGPPPPVRGTLR